MKKAIEIYSKRFKGSKQEDAQEFLRILIEALHDEVLVTGETAINYETSPLGAQEAWNRLIERETSFLFDLFVGLTESILTCSTCKNSSKVLTHWKTLYYIYLMQFSDIRTFLGFITFYLWSNVSTAVPQWIPKNRTSWWGGKPLLERYKYIAVKLRALTS